MMAAPLRIMANASRVTFPVGNVNNWITAAPVEAMQIACKHFLYAQYLSRTVPTKKEVRMPDIKKTRQRTLLDEISQPKGDVRALMMAPIAQYMPQMKLNVKNSSTKFLFLSNLTISFPISILPFYSSLAHLFLLSTKIFELRRWRKRFFSHENNRRNTQQKYEYILSEEVVVEMGHSFFGIQFVFF